MPSEHALVIRLLRTRRWVLRSDRWIARHVGTHHGLVAELRREHAREQPSRRLGLDGAWRRYPRPRDLAMAAA